MLWRIFPPVAFTVSVLIPREARLLNFYLPGGFEKVITEFGVPSESHVIPRPGLTQGGTPQQMNALFQKVGMNTVALPDSLRDERSK